MARRPPKPRTKNTRVICLADLSTGEWRRLQDVLPPRRLTRVIGITNNKAAAENHQCFATLPRKAGPSLVRKTVDAALTNIALQESESSALAELKETKREMEELNQIGIALSETRNVDKLLDMILAKARQITGADAGSLYLVEEEPPDALTPGPGQRYLRFKKTQNDSIQFPFAEFELPLRDDSLAGYAALHGEIINLADAHQIPHGRPYRFNWQYDQETGYRTRSLLTLPMKNGRGGVIGVLQLINCKARRGVHLTSPQIVEREVRPFSARAVRLASSLASQAAVAYENGRLYHDIETLFEGFVQAAVTAIEQRDPTTSGHSHRVSRMTVGLAEIVDRTSAGRYEETRFTTEQMKEIRYAALLHDFGKVGVREEVLVKAKKLYPSQLEILSSRFDYLHKDLEAELERKKVRLLLDMDREDALKRIGLLEEEFLVRQMKLEKDFKSILLANEPTVLPASQFDHLFEIARQTYTDPRGIVRNVLTTEEVSFLSIPQGSLDPEERAQIESHVVHTFNFLLQIPWTREIRDIPRIARAHHEKLNGTGYPYKLRGDEIPVQTKIMTICDIFDALSAANRPYKEAVPPDHALDILEMSVRNQELDPELYSMFVEAKIYNLCCAD